MKLSPLLAALKLAAPALGKDDKALLPALTHFCFDDDFFFAFDDSVAVIVGLKTGLALGLHGETLLGVLGAARTEEVEIKVRGSTATLTGAGRVELPVLEKKDFVFTLPDEQPILTVPLGQDVRHALELCLVGAGEESLQPQYNGVTFRVGKAGTVLYSTDNVSASRAQPPGAKLPARKEAGLVLPKGAAELLLKLFPSEGTPPKMHIGEQVVVVEFGGAPEVTLVAKLLGSPSTRLEDIFKDHLDNAEGFAIPAGLEAEIDKARVLTSRDPIKECSLALSGGKLAVRASGVLGRMATAVGVQSKGEAGVNVSPDLLARMLPHAKQMHINHERSLVLRTEGFDHIISAVPRAMPAEEPAPPPPTTSRVRATAPTPEFDEDDIPF